LKLTSRVSRRRTGKEPGIGGSAADTIAVSSSAETRIVADNLKGERTGSGGKVESEPGTTAELAILAIFSTRILRG